VFTIAAKRLAPQPGDQAALQQLIEAIPKPDQARPELSCANELHRLLTSRQFHITRLMNSFASVVTMAKD
jgi:hypothetical protein